MKLKYTLFLFFTLNLSVFAQQIPQYTQYILNPYILNPAYAGTTSHFDIKANYRKQWLGIEDSPVTMYVTMHGHVGKEHPQNSKKTRNAKTYHHGWGATILKDQTGPLNTIRVQGSYAYDFKLTRKTRLSFGVSAGIKSFSTDVSRIKLFDESNNISVPLTNINSTTPDLSAGLYLYSDKFFVGLSAQNLLFNAIKGSIYGLSESKYARNNYYAQHFFLQGGYVFMLNNSISLVPSMLLKYGWQSPAPSVDFNMKVKYENILFGGFNYRTADAVSLFVGTLISEKFEIAVAYDYGISNIASYTNGSLEFLLGYRIHPKLKIKSPSDYW